MYITLHTEGTKHSHDGTVTTEIILQTIVLTTASYQTVEDLKMVTRLSLTPVNRIKKWSLDFHLHWSTGLKNGHWTFT